MKIMMIKKNKRSRATKTRKTTVMKEGWGWKKICGEKKRGEGEETTNGKRRRKRRSR